RSTGGPWPLASCPRASRSSSAGRHTTSTASPASTREGGLSPSQQFRFTLRPTGSWGCSPCSGSNPKLGSLRSCVADQGLGLPRIARDAGPRDAALRRKHVLPRGSPQQRDGPHPRRRNRHPPTRRRARLREVEAHPPPPHPPSLRPSRGLGVLRAALDGRHAYPHLGSALSRPEPEGVHRPLHVPTTLPGPAL